MWLNTLLLALRSIRRNLLRSFLTILGIVIGVSAVITMVTVGNGATAAVQNQISGLGTNLLQVRPGQRMGPGGSGASATAFKESDGEAIAAQIGGIAAVAPEARTGSVLVANGRNWSSSVIGSTNDWLTTGNWSVVDGRSFTPEELRAGAAVCLIGETVRRELFGATTAVGSALRVRQMSCVDQQRHVAFVVTAAIDGQNRIVADVRYVIDRSGTAPDGTGSAEFAVVVDEGWQRRGVGEHAMQTLMNTAGTAGLGWLHGDVLANNGPMLALMRSCRFCCTPDRDDDHLMRVETSLAARPERLLRSPHRGWRTWMPLWIGAGVASHA